MRWRQARQMCVGLPCGYERPGTTVTLLGTLPLISMQQPNELIIFSLLARTLTSSVVAVTECNRNSRKWRWWNVEYASPPCSLAHSLASIAEPKHFGRSEANSNRGPSIFAWVVAPVDGVQKHADELDDEFTTAPLFTRLFNHDLASVSPKSYPCYSMGPYVSSWL